MCSRLHGNAAMLAQEAMLLPFRKLIKAVPRTREEVGDQSVPLQRLQLSRQFINNFTHVTFEFGSMPIFYGFPCSGSFAHPFPIAWRGICDSDIWNFLKPEIPVSTEAKHRILCADEGCSSTGLHSASCPLWQRSQSVAVTHTFLEMTRHKARS